MNGPVFQAHKFKTQGRVICCNIDELDKQCPKVATKKWYENGEIYNLCNFHHPDYLVQKQVKLSVVEEEQSQ